MLHFLPVCSKYASVCSNRDFFPKCTPSGFFRHTKLALFPNFVALFLKITSGSHTAWTTLIEMQKGSKVVKDDWYPLSEIKDDSLRCFIVIHTRNKTRYRPIDQPTKKPTNQQTNQPTEQPMNGPKHPLVEMHGLI